MFDWLANKKIAVPRVRRALLSLEALEARDCPAAPQIMMFTSAITQGQTVQLSGMVMDENPATVSLNFTGAASGTVTANAQGAFQLTTTASQLGTIYAQATDKHGLTSQMAQSNLSAPTPSLLLNLAHGTGRTVTLGGQVTAGSPGNLTVTFTGQVADTTTTSATGTYSYTTQAAGLGAISAKVTDIWGQQSSTVQVVVASNAPSVSVNVTQGPNQTVFIQGQVNDESPGGLTVTLAGIVSSTVTTTSTGMFMYSGTASGVGAVTASVADCWGLTGSASATLANSAPSISNFQATSSPGNYWTIQGQVLDEFAAGLIVHVTSTIAAFDNLDLTVGSDGWFTYTTQLQIGQSGNIATITTDWWGVLSALASISIS